ncbi:MAG: Unknown protein [uncultured Sulfurovum sp.]|uniref:Uncharacterized protein n=1 Tax=uncultured Sulfurovum sp. TaxID=269237 RepID=A0A6S6TUH9_9BACT|nr:MAG: Unknown protein [uncultured Sulfurovum sp.]
MKKISILIITAFIMLGCSKYDLKPNYKFAENGNGLIYGSLYTANPTAYDGNMFFYTKGGKYVARVDAIDTKPFNKKHDFNKNGNRGSLFTISLPPGEYEIRRFSNTFKFTKTNFIEAKPTTKKVLSFNVTKNNPTYIGSYTIYGGWETKQKATLKINNDMSHDKKYLHQCFPNIGTTKSISQIPNVKVWE